MKKTVLILSAIILISCQKKEMMEDENEESVNTCAVVSNESVPTAVQNAYTSKYPQIPAEKWYNKDDKGFSALFTQNGTKRVAQFDNDGTFKVEVTPPTVTNPPSSTPGNQPPPPCGNQHPQGKCGHHHHKPHPFIPLMGKKKHHHCDCDKDDEKSKECEVVLEN